jgi:response regulator RpfG family c-di-GMP phosphodiesterase
VNESIPLAEEKTGPSRTLLILDDEKDVLETVSSMLENEPYRIFSSGSGKEALEILDKETVQVVLADQRMPGMTGTDFLEQVRERHPLAIRVLFSGYSDLGDILESVNKGGVFRYFTKPFRKQELLLLIRQCFDHFETVLRKHSLMERVSEQNKTLKSLNEELERRVAIQGRVLSLSRKILEKMPVPLLGVNERQELVIANELFRKRFLNQKTLDAATPLSCILPEDLGKRILSSLDPGRKEPLAAEGTWNGISVRIETESFDVRDLTGHLLIIRTTGEELGGGS